MRKIYCIDTFEKPKWILMQSGLWPVIKHTRLNKTKLLFNLIFDISIFVIVIYNIMRAVASKDMKLLNKSTCILIPMINYSAKSWTLLSNKTCFYSILADLESDTFNKHNQELNEHIQLIYRVSRILFRYFVLALVAYLSVGSLLPILFNIGLIIPSPFEGGPLDVYYRCFHFFATAYMAFNTVGFDVLYLTFMSLCTAQLNILRSRLENVLHEVQQYYEHRKPKSCRDRVQEILRECVVLHEMINQFVEKLSVLLSFPLFIQYSCGCFIICNTVLQLTLLRESGSTNILVMCGYSCVTLGQMTTFHFLGNEITFKSDKIIESCYNSSWYDLDVNARKILLILMERAKKPLIVQLYKLIFISLDSLILIFRWAYSVFALIRARYN